MTDAKIVLKDVRKTHILTLPSFPGSKVELFDGILFGDAQEIEKIEDDFQKGLESLVKTIKGWNFTDEEGKELEANRENLKLIPTKDLSYLMENLAKIMESEEQKEKKV